MTPSETSQAAASLPAICGNEEAIATAMARPGPFYLTEGKVCFSDIKSCFAIALHMHQPLIPAGGDDLETASVISNLQHMMNNPGVGDNHNASVFYQCYKRMGTLIPQLIEEGKHPRVMLDYSGCLLEGLRLMKADDVFDDLRKITLDPRYRACVEWLGTAWGHPVAPSTPAQDFRLHVRAWQHQFADLFGPDALSRVRGFSMPEMALPNYPDVAHEFVKTLNECGYHWVLVQEHTVERMGDGGRIEHPHLPHRLMARNSSGQIASIVAIIKTQGSDTKLVGQMQPCYEAAGLRRVDLGGKSIPPIVTQIADGENGGVMMNEFPPKYLEATRHASDSGSPPVNVTEYLEYLASLGLTEQSLPQIQPVLQHRIWPLIQDRTGPEAMEETTTQLRSEDARFHMEGGSWTSDRSWVRGYERVLGPMENASALFSEKVLQGGASTRDPRYRNALYHLLLTQTSCYRFWGQGRWTDYARELCRRTTEILEHDFGDCTAQESNLQSSAP